ncbi:hypothetical protein, partial [Streptococcus pseudopneumoniae]|uniref:hypothetical protein n=1 Tax=Streptococcus pseudopneumoniae TaxID=257758 RepID=UPI0019D68702
VTSHATKFWDDELELLSTGFPSMVPNSSCNGFFNSWDSSNKISGLSSLQEAFGDPTISNNCGGFADRSFTPTLDVYTRVYM